MFKRVLLAFAVVLVPTTAHAATGDVVASYPSSFLSPDGLMWDGQYLWATECSKTRIDKIDPATGSVIGKIDIAGVLSDEMAWDGKHFWISDHSQTEMPAMAKAPPRIYKVDPVSQKVLGYFDAPGQSKYPMGVAWDGKALWNVDTWDKLIFQLDPETGQILRSIPSPANGSCGMTWDGACLWLTDAATDGLVYHIDPANGEVLRTFDGPGGPGHQVTGVAWDGKNLWIHDEASGQAAIHKVEVEDITEGGRCTPPPPPLPDAGGGGIDAGNGADAGAQPPPPPPGGSGDSGGCSASGGQTSPLFHVALGMSLLMALRKRRRAQLRP